MVELFEVDVTTINEHLRNIYKTEELREMFQDIFNKTQKINSDFDEFTKKINKNIIKSLNKDYNNTPGYANRPPSSLF